MNKNLVTCFRAIDTIFEKSFSILLVLGGFLIVLSVVIQVLLRYIFKTPLFGIEEFSLTVAIWAYFIGAVLGTKHDGHVQGDVASLMFNSTHTRAWVKALTWILSLIACTAFFYHATTYSYWVLGTGERTPGLWWPRIITVGSMSFGGIFMMIYCIQNVFKYIKIARLEDGTGEVGAS